METIWHYLSNQMLNVTKVEHRHGCYRFETKKALKNFDTFYVDEAMNQSTIY